jgi:hypothetical protein
MVASESYGLRTAGVEELHRERHEAEQCRREQVAVHPDVHTVEEEERRNVPEAVQEARRTDQAADAGRTAVVGQAAEFGSSRPAVEVEAGCSRAEEAAGILGKVADSLDLEGGIAVDSPDGVAAGRMAGRTADTTWCCLSMEQREN